MGIITKGMGAIMKKLSTASRNKSSKKLFKEKSIMLKIKNSSNTSVIKLKFKYINACFKFLF